MTWWPTPAEIEALRLSVQVAGWCVLVVTVPGVLVGWWLARSGGVARTVVETLVHLPLVLPPVATGYLLLLLLGRQGPVGSRLHRWLGVDLSFTMAAAVLAAAVMGFPLLVRSVRLAVELVDEGLEEAARSLGAGPGRVLGTVTLPLAAPGILTGVVLAFTRSLGEFGATITVAGSIAGETRTLPLALFAATQRPDGDAAATRLMLISVVLSVLALAASEVVARRLGRRLGRP